MAYQNVGTPRFYVSALQWLKFHGLMYIGSADLPISGKERMELFDINPSSPGSFNTYGTSRYIELRLTGMEWQYVMPNENNFMMVLGHTFGSYKPIFYFQEGGSGYQHVAKAGIVNYGNGEATYNGFSVARGASGGDAHDLDIGTSLQFIVDSFTENYTYTLNSILYGTFYDMPHSPDLSLTMTREYGGIKTIETKGGSTLSNANWTKPPNWGDLPAWELAEAGSDWTIPKRGPAALGRSGRRIWDLSFSYLSSSDTFGPNQMIGHYLGYNMSTEQVNQYEQPDITQPNTHFLNYNLLSDDNFFSQVIHKTNGGQLPFIFQPDNSNNNPDQFAIAKLDMKSFKFNQVAHNTYSCKLKIRECW